MLAHSVDFSVNSFHGWGTPGTEERLVSSGGKKLSPYESSREEEDRSWLLIEMTMIYINKWEKYSKGKVHAPQGELRKVIKELLVEVMTELRYEGWSGYEQEN